MSTRPIGGEPSATWMRYIEELEAEAELWREAAYWLAAHNTENVHGVLHHYPNGYANERLAAADRREPKKEAGE